MLGEMGGKPATNPNRLKYLNMTMNLNHRFVVPRREVTLFIHWIEAHTVDLSTLTRTDIKAKLTDRFGRAYRLGKAPVAFVASPRTDTGSHSYAVDHSDIPTRAELIAGKVGVYYYVAGTPVKKGKDVTYKEGMYFHSDPYCKLLADRTTNRDLYAQSFKPQDSGECDVRMMGRAPETCLVDSVTGAEAEGFTQCPTCIRV